MGSEILETGANHRLGRRAALLGLVAVVLNCAAIITVFLLALRADESSFFAGQSSIPLNEFIVIVGFLAVTLSLTSLLPLVGMRLPWKAMIPSVIAAQSVAVAVAAIRAPRHEDILSAEELGSWLAVDITVAVLLGLILSERVNWKDAILAVVSAVIVTVLMVRFGENSGPLLALPLWIIVPGIAGMWRSYRLAGS